MNAVRSESSSARKPRRAASIASRATGPISTSSRPNATRRKLSNVKSARRFTTTIICASPAGGPGRPAWCPSGLRGVPQEELPLRRRVDAGNVLLGGGQIVVEVGTNDRGLIEQELLELPGQLLLCLQIHRGDELLRELVVGGVVETGGIPCALPGLCIDGLQRRRQIQVRHRAGAVVDNAHLAIEPVGLPDHAIAVVLRLCFYREVDGDANLGRGLLDDLRELRDLLDLLGQQRRREPVRDPRLGQQLLSLRYVLRPLRHAVVGGREAGSERAVVPYRCLPLEQRRHD